jgi:hypothetical protein
MQSRPPRRGTCKENDQNLNSTLHRSFWRKLHDFGVSCQ